jgi:hypothetical protein
VKAIKNSLAKLSQIRGMYFSWVPSGVSGKENDDRRHIGVFAQDVLKVFPEAVVSMDEKHMGVRYAYLVPVIIEALRELNEHLGVDVDSKRGKGDKSLMETIKELQRDQIESKLKILKLENSLRLLESKISGGAGN